MKPQFSDNIVEVSQYALLAVREEPACLTMLIRVPAVSFMGGGSTHCCHCPVSERWGHCSFCMSIVGRALKRSVLINVWQSGNCDWAKWLRHKLNAQNNELNHKTVLLHSLTNWGNNCKKRSIRFSLVNTVDTNLNFNWTFYTLKCYMEPNNA